MKKRLYKSSSNKKILGVCAGLAEYLGVDPVLIRLLWIIFALFVGSGVIVYIIAAIIMPYDTEIKDDDETYEYAPRD
ncbi:MULTISPECIES: PspC domain-containing protein [unclassified Treponema]|uniref:PspC domain-containing protein n=1 Tax=unclassified Treponema TaxID=2638727 RepID=UPI0020A58096|nr:MULTISPECIES: PspC domain-containing protein [unclassified Treponema]UTC67106.1 PspC domain-containing protein [Treponema sp. OMZ 789]UTC69837.1 PspC domain-containing protein [Treponema sp. OMZ 790]UTC72551.1 PspC domain-containing protein [Treponema sp. OMZ 791]